MTDNKTQFGPNGSSEFSDDAIRRFLLGQLNATEQSVFEERLFRDDELEARVRLAEIHLADDFAYERLSRPDKERVRQNFLLSADRNQTLAVSQALRHQFDSVARPQAAGAQKFKTLFDFSQPAWRYALAALLLLLVFATVWRGIKEPRLVERIIPKPAVPKPATQTPQETHHPASSSSPVHVEQMPAMPAHEAIALSVLLDPKTTSDNPTIVNPPRNGIGVVRFQLRLEKNQPGPYRAELLGANGDSTFSADSLEPQDGLKINFDIPVRELKTGDHQIKLSRVAKAPTERIATYHFRMQ
jgi:anti-sigma factor RsiW